MAAATGVKLEPEVGQHDALWIVGSENSTQKIAGTGESLTAGKSV
jgi:hypothetical protein